MHRVPPKLAIVRAKKTRHRTAMTLRLQLQGQTAVTARASSVATASARWAPIATAERSAGPLARGYRNAVVSPVAAASLKYSVIVAAMRALAGPSSLVIEGVTGRSGRSSRLAGLDENAPTIRAKERTLCHDVTADLSYSKAHIVEHPADFRKRVKPDGVMEFLTPPIV